MRRSRRDASRPTATSRRARRRFAGTVLSGATTRRALAARGAGRRLAREGRAPAPPARARRAFPSAASGWTCARPGFPGSSRTRRVAYETVRYEVRDDGVATIALDQPDTRNALSNELLRRPDRRVRARARRRRRALRRAHLHAREGLLGGRQPRPVRRGRPARPQALRHRALPAAVQDDHGARQAHHLRGERPRAGRLARRRARLRPDRGEGQRHLRHARDQRGRVPVHDHGADLPQRAAQEGERDAAARRAHVRRGGARGGHREPGGAGRGVRRRGGRMGRASSRRSRRC